jgi:hypothetical protein
MTNIMINVMTAWKKVHSHSGQLSTKTGVNFASEAVSTCGRIWR